MKSHIAAARAVTSVFVRRQLFVISLAVFGLLGLLAILSGYGVVQESAWWLLVFIPAIIVLLVALIVRAILSFLLTQLLPRSLSKQELAQITQFTEKVGRVADVRGASKFALLFHLIKDALVYRDMRYVTNLLEDTKSLKSDFAAITVLFE